MMRSARAATLALLAWASASTFGGGREALVAAKIDPNDKGEPLFPDGHPNITYLTDDNWDTWMEKTDKPWLVDFYHPFCPHCKQFAPTFFKVAAYYKEKGDVYVGAISCMDHVKCRRVGIKGFPTLITLNFDKKNPKAENKRVVGTHTLQEVKDYVNSVFLEARVNETGTQPPGNSTGSAAGPVGLTTEPQVKPGEQLRKELWEESTLPMNHTTRLQDAGSAFIFGLKQGVFMGREVLEDVELDALKSWLKMVAQTFPGAINRKLIQKLAARVEPVGLLDFDTFDALVREWQQATVFDFKFEESKLNFSGAAVAVPEWQRRSDLFLGEGVTYRACALYTCGQWNMFHMLTMNPPEPHARSAELLVSVIATIRRFVKHFFGCVQCRDHFLEYNTLERVKALAGAANKPLALKRWLWEMHNAVNKRIMHPLWPKPDVCPTCGHEDNWELVEVDKWLGNTYAFREVPLPPITEPPKTAAPPTTEAAPHKALREPADTSAPAAAAAAAGGPSGYKPKDAELGIANRANTKELVQNAAAPLDANAKADAQGLQGVRAPPVSLFAWYFLPVLAVGAYLLFVRSRRSAKHKGYRHPGGSE
ncbi:hypothetical protein PybrP1_004369 [[Pythium] brassicae (nom. inval.)]|nr:hypothetical protein PybrP1_004369 [[Pythium] brassicae (nom. inval.)]